MGNRNTKSAGVLIMNYINITIIDPVRFFTRVCKNNNNDRFANDSTRAA